MVLDAVERLGIEPSYCAGHSLGEYTALTATGALGFDDGVRLVVERGAAMHDAGLDPAGHHGRRPRPRRRPRRDRLSPRRRRRVGRQLQRPRPGRDRRFAARRRRGRRPCQGARRQEGDAAPGVAAPSTPRSWRRPATGCARPSPRPTCATPTSRSSRTSTRCAHDQGADWASLLSAQLSSPVRWKHCPAHPRRERRHRLRRARPRQRCSPAWPSARSPTARTISVVDPRRPRQAARVGRRPARRRPAAQHEGEHLFAVERLVVSPGAGVFTPIGIAGGGIRHHGRSGARPRRRPRGPLAVRRHSRRATSPSTASGSPPASRSPGCAATDHDERGDLTRCQQYRPASEAR